jgi:hypothetical protein
VIASRSAERIADLADLNETAVAVPAVWTTAA